MHQHRRKLHIAINTFAHPDGYARWQRAVDMAAQLGADALIWPISPCWSTLRSVTRTSSVTFRCRFATNEEAIRFYHRNFDVARRTAARVCRFDQVKQLAALRRCRWSFAFGSLCIMAEGRC